MKNTSNTLKNWKIRVLYYDLSELCIYCIGFYTSIELKKKKRGVQLRDQFTEFLDFSLRKSKNLKICLSCPKK